MMSKTQRLLLLPTKIRQRGLHWLATRCRQLLDDWLFYSVRAPRVVRLQYLADGSCLVFRQSRQPRPRVILCGRENFNAQGRSILFRLFFELGFEVIEHQSPAERLARAGLARLTPSRQSETIAARVQSLCAAIDALGQAPSLIVGHSTGGRVATLASACRAVPGLVLFGYPFRHPDQGDEPERYAHLATLQTPTLIVQGEYDPYGGKGIAEKYPISPAVSLRFVPTNHDLENFEMIKGVLKGLIQDFNQQLATPGLPVQTIAAQHQPA